MIDSLPVALAVLAACSLAVVVAGPKMVRAADRLADVTGLGEALVGAVLVGLATSLPGLLATASPAAADLPDRWRAPPCSSCTSSAWPWCCRGR